jgi:hypothetical protein
MHYDRESAQGLSQQTSVLRVLLWVLVALLLAFVLALALRNRDAQQKIEQLEETSDVLSQRMAACEDVRDDLTDLQRRVTSVEAQFWE